MRKETWGAQYVLMQEIGRKVKETREKLGIPPEILAFQTNSRITIIRNIESGNTFPSVGRLATIAKALGVTTDWLLGKDEIELKPLPEDFIPVDERCARLEESCKTLGEQIEDLRKKLEVVWKLVLENCASENATQELLVDRSLATRKELDEREEKYKSDLDIAVVPKAL